MTGLAVVGRPVPRLEAVPKATGSLRYVADLVRPWMLHARFVRSPYPHAEVRSIDDRAALAIRGVALVLSVDTIDALRPGLGSFDLACGALDREPETPVLPGDARIFDRRVRYVGEPVALVLADTHEAAAEGAELVDVEYERLPAVLDPESALAAGAPTLHAGAPGNVVGTITRRSGDVAAAFSQAAVVVERTFATGRQKHAQLEPTACLAEVDGDGKLTVTSPHQAPHRARYTLAKWLDLPETLVRVVVPPIGGAFGKSDALGVEAYAAVAALVTQRAVRLVLSRNEDFVGTDARHPTVSTIRAAFRSDATLIALEVRSVVDAGAYLGHSSAIAAVMASQFLAQYRLEAADIEVRVAFTNTSVSGAFRGYGGPQAVFPLEHVIDLACRQLGVDPIEARDRMRVRKGDRWGYLEQPIETDAFGDCLRIGAERSNWSEIRRAPRTAGTRRRGIGMAAVVWKSGIVGKALDHSSASVRLNPDGTALLATAAADLGTGVRTTLAQVCAETLGLPLSRVDVSPTDTDTTPYDTGAFASRSLYRNGQAVQRAAAEVRRQLLEYAGTALEIDPRDLAIVGGAVSPRDAPEQAIPLGALLRRALIDGREFHAHASAPLTNAPTFATQFAEVVVDTETGEIDVRRVVAVHDVGRAINPPIVEGQIQGAVHQGLGYALSEGLVVDRETGTILNGTFMDYRLLTAADSPPIDVVLIEEPDSQGPFGAKGVGEPGIVAAAPAVANAILDAIGCCPTELPMTPERVLAALREAAR